MFDVMRAWIVWVLMAMYPQPPQPPEVQYAQPQQKDYVAMVAAEAAYTTLLSGTPSKPEPAPTPVDPANCSTCKGLGKVPTGDGQGWTKCPTCKGGTGDNTVANAAAAPTCTSGTCSLQSPAGAATPSVPPGQTFRRR